MSPALGPAAQERRPAVRERVDLTRDTRLQRAVTLSGEPAPLHEVLAGLKAQLDLEVLTQFELRNRPVSLQVRSRRAAAVLEDLAALFQATWIRHEGGYLLAADRRIAELARTRPKEPESLWAEFVRSLATSVRQRFAPRLPFAVRYLTAGEQAQLRPLLVEAYFQAPDRRPLTVTQGENVALRVDATGEEKTLSLLVPTATKGPRFEGQPAFRSPW